MTEPTAHTEHLPEHEATYAAFIRGSVALCLLCAFVLVALCSFAFGATLPTLTGFAGLVGGSIVVLNDLRTGSPWYLSGGFLVAFGLLTAINVS